MRGGGIVVCGGRSSRMGRPKAWLPFGGEVMLQRVVRVLREVADPVVVVAAPGQDLPALPSGVEIARDEHDGRGPLQGLAAGLAALGGRVDAAYLSACDVPFLRPEFVRRVVGLLAVTHRDGPYRIAVPQVGGYYHPLAAAYRADVLPDVRQLLAADRLRTTLLFDRVATRVLGPDDLAGADPALDSLRNLNTPEDYAAAVAALGTTG